MKEGRPASRARKHPDWPRASHICSISFDRGEFHARLVLLSNLCASGVLLRTTVLKIVNNLLTGYLLCYLLDIALRRSGRFRLHGWLPCLLSALSLNLQRSKPTSDRVGTATACQIALQQAVFLTGQSYPGTPARRAETPYKTSNPLVLFEPLTRHRSWIPPLQTCSPQT